MDPQTMANDTNAPASQTAQDYISSQLELEAEAREALPYQFDTCTKPMGPLRQTVFSCLTCNPPPSGPLQSYAPAGVCYSCSISCHTEHELVELFSRRDFECDCGTTRLPSTSQCSLRINAETGRKGGVQSESPREGNKYNHNYRNRFCGCGELYDPHKQEGTMFQCLGLGTTEDGGCGEDWWHPECIMGISKDWRKQKASYAAKEHTTLATNGGAAHIGDGGVGREVPPTHEQENAEGEEEEDDELPPGFPHEDDFEHLLCYKCVEAHPWIKSYAGATGFLTGIEHRSGAVLNNATHGIVNAESNATIEQAQEALNAKTLTSKKRSFDDAELQDGEADGSQSTKKVKGAEDAVPVSNGESTCKLSTLPEATTSRISLLLKEDFRDNLCHCASCFPLLKAHAQLLDEEDTYEPPRSESEAGGDDSAHSVGTRSLLDRGEAALSNMDRVRAIEGVMAYNHLKDKVKGFLKPYAESGEAVGAEDIKKYFEKLRGDEQALREAGITAGGDSGNGGDNRREQSGH